VITCPPNITLEYSVPPTTINTGLATATDTCSGVPNIGFVDSFGTTNCTGKGTILRTWTAIDGCGNRASCVQTIRFQDTTAPVINCPTNINLECTASPITANTGAATATDTGSGIANISFADAFSTTNCTGKGTILRTWTATDGCGNRASCVQTINFQDTTPPVIVCPANITLECPLAPTTNNTGVATATDSCSGVSNITFVDVFDTTNCTGKGSILRTWTATDGCGNQSSCVQTIRLKDTTPPVITCPPNITLECTVSPLTANTGLATASDTCSAVTNISFVDTFSTTNCTGKGTILRTWTAADACGNTSSCVQTISFKDTVPPVIVCPTNITLECTVPTTTNNTGVATATDTCNGVANITFSDAFGSANCTGQPAILRTWTATDGCGNRASCTQTITMRDTIKPTLICPPDLVLECPADTRTNATGVASAQDGCGAVTLTYSDSVSNNCGGTRIVSRLWTATDACSNSTNAVQMITVRDMTPPALRLPANLVLQCPGDTSTNVTGAATALDGCGSVTITYSDVVSNGCGVTRTVLRLWTATDLCGNRTNGLQTISVVDTAKPTIICPPNLAVQCVADVPAAYTDLATFQAAGGTATDSCSPTLTFVQTSDSGLVGSCPGKVTRVYRATDACGNFAECTQTITVADTIAPVLTCVPNMRVECGVSLDPATIGGATATDNCATNVLVTHSDAVVQAEYDLKFYVADPDSGTGPYSPSYLKFGPASLPCPESARLTGRALDPLRNAVAYAPSGQLDALTSIGNVPMAFGQIVPFETVIQVTGGAGPERGTIEFTAAWNTYTTSNNRFGYDTNYMVYCAFVDAADPGSIDPNNNARVESYSSVVVNPGTIAEAIQGTFRVSGLDAGDRVVVEIWVVLMSSMPDHSGGTVAASLVSAQKASVPPVPITVGTQTDSLGNLSKIAPLPPPQEQPPLGPLPPQPPVLPGATVSVMDRTWTAIDDCGNRSTCVQRITVSDTAPPVLTAPPDMVLDCPASDTSTNVTGVAVAQDACGSTKLYYSDNITNGCSGARVISRTWTATDNSGNSTNAVQTITVQDRPVITCPINVTLECGAQPTTNNTGVATATDACSGVAGITFSDATDAANCTGRPAILRTWTASNGCGNRAS